MTNIPHSLAVICAEGHFEYAALRAGDFAQFGASCGRQENAQRATVLGSG